MPRTICAVDILSFFLLSQSANPPTHPPFKHPDFAAFRHSPTTRCIRIAPRRQTIAKLPLRHIAPKSAAWVARTARCASRRHDAPCCSGLAELSADRNETPVGSPIRRQSKFGALARLYGDPICYQSVTPQQQPCHVFLLDRRQKTGGYACCRFKK